MRRLCNWERRAWTYENDRCPRVPAMKLEVSRVTKGKEQLCMYEVYVLVTRLTQVYILLYTVYHV